MPKRTAVAALALLLVSSLLGGCANSYRFGIEQARSFAATGQAESTRGTHVSLDDLDSLGPVLSEGQVVAGETMSLRADHPEWEPLAPDASRFLRAPDPQRVVVTDSFVEIHGPRRSVRFDATRVEYLVGSADQPGLTVVAVVGGVLGTAVLVAGIVFGATLGACSPHCFGG